MLKKMFSVVAVAMIAAPSYAGFITADSNDPAANTTGIATNNDFRTTLAGLGVTTYTTGASLATDEAGSVSFFYYGKEAGYRNTFTAGALSHNTGATPTHQNYFGAPISLGSFDVVAGLLDFSFCAYNGNSSIGCVSNAQNDVLGMLSFQSIAMSIASDSAWLFWDDSGAGPDDNHDDMIVRAVFTPRAAVPEPTTLALFGLGLLGLGLSKRRKA